MRHRILPRFALAGLLLLAASGVVRAQDIDAAKAAKLKAAYLLNFVKYAQWPENCFSAPESPIVLTLVGQCDVTNVLTGVVSQTEPVGGRSVALHHAALPGETAGEDAWKPLYASLKGSHLLYICGLRPERVQSILRSISDADVLTVSDIPSFATNGGMLGFVLRGNRILFEANLDAIQKTDVAVSAKVLQLAQIVGGRHP